MNKLKKVLVVEDDYDIRTLISIHLKKNHFQVEECKDVFEARQKIQHEFYDVVVLDWMLPGSSGTDLIPLIRSKPRSHETAIIMVTARQSEDDIVHGLEIGADDYLVKPFKPAVLMARIKALIRRKSPYEKEEVHVPEGVQIYSKHGLVVDWERFFISYQDQEILLTPMEFKLFFALIQNEGRVLSRNKLIQLAQGDGVAVIERAVDTHLFAVRKKLGMIGEVVETVRGVGYRFKSEVLEKK